MTQTDFDFEPKMPTTGTLNAWVLECLRNGGWWMPFEMIGHIAHYYNNLMSDSSCTARIRDLRKPRYGSHVIEKRIRTGSRAYECRLVK